MELFCLELGPGWVCLGLPETERRDKQKERMKRIQHNIECKLIEKKIKNSKTKKSKDFIKDK